MRDSRTLRCRHRRAGDGGHPTGQMQRKMKFRPHPYWVCPEFHGFSHGLKKVQRLFFTPVSGLVPPFRIHPHPLPIGKATLWGGFSYWQRMRDSNPRKRSQSPVCYRYTNPLYLALIICTFLQKSRSSGMFFPDPLQLPYCRRLSGGNRIRYLKDGLPKKRFIPLLRFRFPSP